MLSVLIRPSTGNAGRNGAGAANTAGSTTDAGKTAGAEDGEKGHKDGVLNTTVGEVLTSGSEFLVVLSTLMCWYLVVVYSFSSIKFLFRHFVRVYPASLIMGSKSVTLVDIAAVLVILFW